MYFKVPIVTIGYCWFKVRIDDNGTYTTWFQLIHNELYYLVTKVIEASTATLEVVTLTHKNFLTDCVGADVIYNAAY